MIATEECESCGKEVNSYQMCSCCGAIVCDECFDDVYDTCPECSPEGDE